MRLRSNLCLWTSPPPYSGRGRPRIHGSKFKISDTDTWATPAQILEENDQKLGRIQIRVWHDLHFRAAAKHSISLILVERLNNDGSLRVTKPLWLAWVGNEMPPLSEIWRFYLRRFAVEHWYRFIKQRLHWTLPKLSTPKQCERWSELMPIITWELWLARDIVRPARMRRFPAVGDWRTRRVADNPLPWQKSIDKLTPGRVAQAMGGVLAGIATPALSPKTRGKSPGWETGKTRKRRIPYPIVKKRTYKPRKSIPESA